MRNTDPLRLALEEQDDETVSVAKAANIETFSALEDRAKIVAPPNPVEPPMVLSFFPTAEGFYDYENLRYIYQYKDHLGNVRVSFVKEGSSLKIMDSNDYYPFGLSFLKPVGNATVYDPMTVPYNYKYNGKELQETGMYAMDWRNYLPDIGRFTGMDAFAELYVDKTPYHFAMNNPAIFSDPTGLYTRDANGNISTSNQNEIRDLMGYFGGGGSVGGLDNHISGNSNFALDLPELELKGSRFNKFFTGDYFSKSNIRSVFNHLDKHIGSMSTIDQWDGDIGFRGNWANSDGFFSKASYGFANNTYLAIQTLDTFNWLNAKQISGVTGNLTFSNIDGTSQFNAGDRGMAFATTFNPIGAELKFLGAGQQVLPKAAFRLTEELSPLSASQFSSLFKGTSIAGASPATRGMLNRFLNKGLNSVNSVNTFKSGYTGAIKPLSPNNNNNDK